MLKSKILLVLSCIILSLCIGSIYSWSIFILPIQKLTQFSLSEIQLVFCLTIFTLGITTSFGGKFINSHEPYIMALLGSFIFSFGMIATGLSLIYAPQGIYLWYGLSVGVGVGIIYLIPIPLLLQEFCNNPASGSSISILAFGFGSALFVSIANLFSSITQAFIWIGLFYGIIMIISSFLLKNRHYNDDKIIVDDISLYKHEALRTKEFYYIFIMMFINIFVGISLISIAAPLGNELLINSALLVAIIGIFNGLGRPVFAALADKIGYINIYKCLFIIQILCIMLCVFNINSILTTATLCIIASCYGAGFACLPALTAYIFGKMNVQQIFGSLLFAWGLAGLIAPLLISLLCTYLGSYFMAFILIASLYFIGLYCSIKIKRRI